MTTDDIKTEADRVADKPFAVDIRLLVDGILTGLLGLTVLALWYLVALLWAVGSGPPSPD